MNFPRTIGCGVLTFVLGLTVSRVPAQVTNYSNRAAFNTAVSPNVLEDFTSNGHYPIASGILNSSTNQVVEFGSPIHPGDIQPGVTYSAPVGNDGKDYFNIDASIGPPSGIGFSGGFLDTLDYFSPSRPITVAFDNPTTGFGFDTAVLVAGSTFSADLTFADGSTFQEVVVTPTDANFHGYAPFYVGFVGFQGLKDIRSVALSGTSTDGYGFGFDNFAFYNPLAPVPEAPTTVSLGLLLALGTGGVVIAAKKKKTSTIA